jgi:hypothetical protein
MIATIRRWASASAGRRASERDVQIVVEHLGSDSDVTLSVLGFTCSMQILEAVDHG